MVKPLILILILATSDIVEGCEETHSAHRYSMSISRVRFCCRMIST
jgi:hypothetical protein